MRHLKAPAIVILRLIMASVFAVSSCGDATGTGADNSKSDKDSSSPQTSAESEKQVLLELERLEKEARVAAEEEDWPRTKQLLGQGLEIIETQDGKFELQRARFLLAEGNMARERARETEARRNYADAMAIFHVHKNSRGRFETHIALGKLESRRGDYVAAGREFKEAEDLLKDINDALLKGIFQMEEGRLAGKMVDRQKARQHYLEAIRVFEAEKDKIRLAQTLVYLAHEEDGLGNTDKCRRRLDRALALYRELKDKEGEASVLHRLARIAEREKHYKLARKLLKKVCDIYGELDRTADALRVKRHINALPEQN